MMNFSQRIGLRTWTLERVGDGVLPAGVGVDVDYDTGKILATGRATIQDITDAVNLARRFETPPPRMRRLLSVD